MARALALGPRAPRRAPPAPRPGRVGRACAYALAAACVGLGCGKRGDPLPPLRKTPQPVTDLRVLQRGDRVEVSCVVPRATTDGERLPVLEVELLRADTAGDLLGVALRKREKAAPGETLIRDEPLPPSGTTLRFAARAIARGRASAMSPVVSLTVQSPPPAPTALTAEPSARGVALQWAPPGGGPLPPPSPAPAASGSPGGPAPFRVYRRAKEGAYWRPLLPTPVAPSTFEDATARVGEAWCYVVRTVAATNPVVESGDSPEACLTVTDVVPPSSPTGVAALIREGGIELSWSPSPEPDLALYRVYRGPMGETPERIAEVPAGETVYLDKAPAPGIVFSYTVTAVDRAGNESPPSSPAEAGLR